MCRWFAALVCMALVGGSASADERLVDSERIAIGILDGVDRESSKQRLVQMLLEIKDRQLLVESELRRRRDDHVPPCHPKTAAIGEAAPVVLIKGGRAKVKHAIRWRQYDKDELTVTVTASDASLKVPAKLVLEFEKHELGFEYEIAAGDKAGNHSITLTPEAGRPVVVWVTVK